MRDFVIGDTDGIEIQTMQDQNFLVIAGFPSSDALVILRITVYNSLLSGTLIYRQRWIKFCIMCLCVGGVGRMGGGGVVLEG